ncbi:MAG: DUF2007 domain-containing protein [Alcanivoracaceae bacterium]|jgi:hypothetical protein|nr:DUF2007 domain-containing protein [Alcanivoracaceae bacterium]
MKPVYEAENALDANLAKGILNQMGIGAVIKGEYLQGGIGDIPLAGLVTVMVEDADERPAREVLQRWQNGELTLDTEHTEHHLPLQANHPAPVTAGQPFSRTIAAFLIGAVIAGTAVHLWYKTPQFSYGIDIDGDGVEDTYLHWQGDYLDREDLDRDQDGKLDGVRHYDSRGILSSWQYDNDFDGRHEVSGRIVRAGLSYEDTDQDGDGVADSRNHFYQSVYTMTEFYAEDGQQVIKRFIYRDKGVTYVELDSDGDGSMDIFHIYNDIDEIDTVFDSRAALMEEVSRRQRQ